MRESINVLIVCSSNSGSIAPFVGEQVESLKEMGIEIEIFSIVGKGLSGYLRNAIQIRNIVNIVKPDIIHAHYGLSGLAARLFTSRPLVITFHGSDAYIPFVRRLSKIAARLSSFNIFVEEKLKKRINRSNKNIILPCGINLDFFYPMDKNIAREMIGLNQSKKYILFSSGFDIPVKQFPLAKSAVEKIDFPIEILELKNRTRVEVNLLLNACDVSLLTSKSEGSPQFIKEAMACNCPIVSTDVGDIKYLIGNTEGCYLTTSEPQDIANKIKLAINFGKRTNGRKNILDFDNKIIAGKIIEVYKRVLNNNE